MNSAHYDFIMIRTCLARLRAYCVEQSFGNQNALDNFADANPACRQISWR